MAQVLDCLVSYFGLDDQEKPALARYYCYHVLGGPGPTAEAGVAFIATLAVHDERERCTYCQPFHAVEVGGPAAAVAEAVRYLDGIHRGMNLTKVQSELRGLTGGPGGGGRLPGPGALPANTERDTP